MIHSHFKNVQIKRSREEAKAPSLHTECDRDTVVLLLGRTQELSFYRNSDLQTNNAEKKLTKEL